MLINNTDALRWLVCVVISLCLPLPVQKTGLLFSLVFVLISARPKQRKFLLAVLGSCHFVLAAETAAGARSTADQRHGECGFRQQLYPRKSAGPLSGNQ